MKRRGSGSPPGDGDYMVGYGKPPVQTRFKAGNPGRPRGSARQPRSVSLEDIVQKAMRRRVKLRRGDQIVDVGLTEVLINRIFTMATQGSARDVGLILNLLDRYAPDAPQKEALLEIIHHRAPGSTVELPPADLWRKK